MKFYRGDNEGKQSHYKKFGCCQLKFFYKPMDQPITAGHLEGCDWLLHRFMEVYISKFIDSKSATKFSGMILFAIIIVMGAKI